jgi:hypothetical protein
LEFALRSASLSAGTDVRTYDKSLGSSKTILPGLSIYIEGRPTHAATTEVLKAGEVAVVDRFYRWMKGILRPPLFLLVPSTDALTRDGLEARHERMPGRCALCDFI